MIKYLNMKCNPSFQTQYAIVGSKQIYIDEFQESEIPRCIPCKHELIAVYPKDRKSYFRHKNRNDMEGHPMTEWHAEWQSHFPITEKQFNFKDGQIRNRRADAVLPEYNIVLEFQHSKINSGEVNERKKDYALHNQTVKWIIDSQECIEVKFGERRILEFKTEWLFQSFLDYDEVYYDIKGFIYKVNPQLIKSFQIDVKEPKPKMEFIEAVKRNDVWLEEESQYYLYVKQQGAGSGKTYGMIQLLNTEFSEYKYILFITKQHSAVYVMYKEFKDQYDKGILNNIKLIEYNQENKKYIITYKHILTNIEVKVIFATVDSFTYALGESTKNEVDKFVGIAKSIADGTIKTARDGTMKYAGINPILNKESIIMIDETQDLIKLYGEAFLKIISSKYTNLCIVGDRLQSLNCENNALTYLYEADKQYMKCIKSEASNIIRRFSDETLINFVNKMIPFDTYDLPEMISLHPTNDENTLTIFCGESVYQKDANEKIIESVKDIMKYYINEVKTMNRIPEDFMIITPFTSRNILVDALQIRLNEFWKDLMENDTEYIKNVKNNNEYWKDINTNEYTKYAIFHKSEEGTSIDLSESEHTTRIVSIHSSKGDGRKVVFVIGITESALQKFSKISNNLIYNSLLHVAITRQKERLYFRLEQNNDNIDRRIKDTKYMTENNSTTFIPQSTYINCNVIYRYIEQNEITFKEFYSIVEQYLKPFPKINKDKQIIDMSHHIIRYASMFINIMIHSLNHELMTDSNVKKQNRAILHKIDLTNIITVDNSTDYHNILKKNYETENKNNKYEIPILKFNSNKNDVDYEKYYNIIKESMHNICVNLIDLGKCKLMYICPYESVLLYYMMECIDKGYYQDITINDIYNLTHIYYNEFYSIYNTNSHENCKCIKLFNSQNISNSKHSYLINHYEELKNIINKLDKFVLCHPHIEWKLDYGLELQLRDEFACRYRFDMFGLDRENVYMIYIQPQLNELNYNLFIIKSIINTFIWKYSNKDDRNILSCVITTDSNDIHIEDFTQIVKDKHDWLLKQFHNILYDIFSSNHKRYLETFTYLSTKCESPEKLMNELKEKLYKKDKKGNKRLCIAPYIEQVFNNILGKLDECSRKEKQKTFMELMSSPKTITMMDTRLDNSLRLCLGIDDSEN